MPRRHRTLTGRRERQSNRQHRAANREHHSNAEQLQHDAALEELPNALQLPRTVFPANLALINNREGGLFANHVF